MSPITRREFLIRTGKAVAATAAVTGTAAWFYKRAWDTKTPLTQVRSFATDSGSSQPVLSIARRLSTTGAELVQQALAGLGGMQRFVDSGDVVLIKPNAAFATPAVFGATTSPEVLAEVITQSFSAGAKRVIVVDNPIGNARSCFDLSGLGQAAVRAGAEIYLPSAEDFRTVSFPGRVIGKWDVLHKPLAMADKLIGLPTLKTHNRCEMSAAMKNWYGFLGGRRGVLHQNLHGAIADLAELFIPTLVILDATRKLIRNGPTGGSFSDVEAANTVVAGTDQVAIDVLAAEMLNLEPPQFIRTAANRGLGDPNWREVPHVGNF